MIKSSIENKNFDESHGFTAELGRLQRLVMDDTVSKMEKHYVQGNMDEFNKIAKKAKKFKNGIMIAKVREVIKTRYGSNQTSKQKQIIAGLDNLA